MATDVSKILVCSSYFSISRKGKHASTAKIHLDEVVGFLTKIDPSLGNLAVNSMPGDTSSDNASKRDSSATKKRKKNGKDTPDTPVKKKANVANNGHLTLSQREKRAMELLAAYLEERGGVLPALSAFYRVSQHHLGFQP